MNFEFVSNFRYTSRHIVLDAKKDGKFLRSVGVYDAITEVGSVKSSIPNTVNLVVRFVDKTEATMGEYVSVNGDGFPRVKYMKAQRVVSMAEALQRARRFYMAKNPMCGKREFA